MKKSNLLSSFRRFTKRFFEAKLSFFLAILLCALSGVVTWSLAHYSFKVAIGEARVIGLGVGVYWDINCDNPIRSLSWGKIVINPLKPEASKSITIYVRNEGSVPAAIRLNASRWFPLGIEKHMHLRWDYDEHVLGVYEVVRVMLTLSVDSKICFESPWIEDFSFDIIISASSS